MTPEQKDKLKQGCGRFLHINGLKPNTKSGAKAVHTFWYGALCALEDTQNAWVTISLLSGRFEDLVEMPK